MKSMDYFSKNLFTQKRPTRHAEPKPENNAVLSYLHFSKFRVRIKVELKL